jgi:ABC-type branched-subunit amino acid transport system substrate-binding protein
MQKTRKRVSWLAFGAALTLLSVACSSSSKSTSSGTTASTAGGSTAPTTAANNGSSGSGQAYLSIQGGTASDLRGTAATGLTRGVTATDVTLGCIYQAAYYSGFDTGIKAKLNAVNKSGGVFGRTIKLLPCQDDNGDGPTDLSDTRQQVQQSNAFGMIYNTVGALPATTDFLSQNQVPFVGWGTLPGWCGTRWGFGYNGCLAAGSAPGIVPTIYYNTALVDPAMQLAKVTPQNARAAIIGNDNAASKAGNAQFQTLFEQQGAKVVYNQANVPASGFVDYTPYIQAVIATNPNVIILDTTFGNIGGLSSGLVNAGYKSVIMNFVAYTPTLASTPDLAKALQGGYVNLQIEPQETNSSYIQQEQSDLSAIGAPTSITLGTAQGYEMANLWVQMLQAAGQNLNTKTFDDAVNNSGTFVSKSGHANGAGDIKWPSGHFIPVPCAAIVQIENGKYVSALPYSCYSAVVAKS